MATDSLLVLGKLEDRLLGFLEKLGYDVVSPSEPKALPELLRMRVPDIVVVDTKVQSDGVDWCQFIRSQQNTKKVPIVVLAHDSIELEKHKRSGLDRLTTVSMPASVGAVAGKIATELRLRKLAGVEERGADLAETNAALRDLTERFTREREEARKIQETLLPAALPTDPRVDIATTYQPLDEVGGDWYYVLQEQSGKISAHIADVTGHGLSAAFICSMTKLALSAVAHEEPAALMEGLNKLLTPQMPQGRFVTMGSLLFDPVTGVLKSVRAGHPPAMILQKATKAVTELKSSGFAIGFMDDGSYPSEEVTLEVGDVALLYTDGISEAQNRALEQFGTERLMQVLRESPVDETATALIERILSTFHTFRGGRLLKDDITIVALRRVG